MKLQGILLVPEATIEFDKDDVAFMMECSQRHYDLTCKQAGRPGGILWGMQNQLTVSATARRACNIYDIDLLAKITEELYQPPNPLHTKLMRVFDLLNDIYKKENTDDRVSSRATL